MLWERDAYRVSTDRELLDIDLIHHYLSLESYWARGIPRAIVEKSVRNALCFGLFYHESQVSFQESQVGFARVTTDYATFAYLGDVFVLEAHRGNGLGKWLIACVTSHPELQNLRRWMLATADAHALYTKYNFTSLAKPEKFMELHNPAAYQ